MCRSGMSGGCRWLPLERCLSCVLIPNCVYSTCVCNPNLHSTLCFVSPSANSHIAPFPPTVPPLPSCIYLLASPSSPHPSQRKQEQITQRASPTANPPPQSRDHWLSTPTPIPSHPPTSRCVSASFPSPPRDGERPDARCVGSWEGRKGEGGKFAQDQSPPPLFFPRKTPGGRGANHFRPALCP